ncbi:MAG TPA: PEGA domain-containing protein [Kofleriaceae bacterium]|nr:PEGA domain-containing protein [Kofleriaceae bacterium]
MRIRIDTEPAGAEVHVAGRRIGCSPISIELIANTHLLIEIRKDGYLPLARSAVAVANTRLRFALQSA